MDAVVAYLRYEIEWPATDHRQVDPAAPPLRIPVGGFVCEIVGMSMMAYPTTPVPSVEEARAALEPALHAWEAAYELADGPSWTFAYNGHGLRSPTGGNSGTASFNYDVTNPPVLLPEFPRPDPERPIEGPTAHQMRRHWRDYLRNHERLSSAAYGALTAVEQEFAGELTAAQKPGPHRKRRAAAVGLRVSHEVLNKIGDLTARDDEVHGRAHSKPTEQSGPLTNGEVGWLQAVMPVLILRMSDYEALRSHLPEITMADLPFLPAAGDVEGD